MSMLKRKRKDSSRLCDQRQGELKKSTVLMHLPLTNKDGFALRRLDLEGNKTDTVT